MTIAEIIASDRCRHSLDVSLQGIRCPACEQERLAAEQRVEWHVAMPQEAELHIFPAEREDEAREFASANHCAAPIRVVHHFTKTRKK